MLLRDQKWAGTKPFRPQQGHVRQPLCCDGAALGGREQLARLKASLRTSQNGLRASAGVTRLLHFPTFQQLVRTRRSHFTCVHLAPMQACLEVNQYIKSHLGDQLCPTFLILSHRSCLIILKQPIARDVKPANLGAQRVLAFNNYPGCRTQTSVSCLVSPQDIVYTQQQYWHFAVESLVRCCRAN